MRFAPSLFRRFFHSEDGTAAIEFSIVVPIFLLVTFFLIELCTIGFSAVSIENSVNTTMRLAKTGNIPSSMPKDQFIRDQIRERAYGLIEPERLVVTSQVVSSTSTPPDPSTILNNEERCQAADGSYTGSACPCTSGTPFEDKNGDGVCTQPVVDIGAPGDIIVYTATYRYQPLTPFVPFSSLFGGVALGQGSNHEVLLVSSGATRIEPN